MPVVGSSPYNSAGQITSLVRSLLNDSQGPTRCFCLTRIPRIAKCNALGNSGAVTAQDASLQVSITDATAPPNQLPADLLVPVKLWERANGSSDDFAEMVDLTRHGGLPSREQDV